jgi:hypothetical protein
MPRRIERDAKNRARRRDVLVFNRSRLLNVNGFSQKTCLAAAAATTWPACIECGVASTTASIAGSVISAS